MKVPRAPLFWISPMIPWTACIATVTLTLLAKERFDRSAAPLPAVVAQAA
ncbi:MAG TPA: hypothetical protein VGI46_11295 [Candidatus Acidoferrum sp.]|jgi:hypothetical protein